MSTPLIFSCSGTRRCTRLPASDQSFGSWLIGKKFERHFFAKIVASLPRSFFSERAPSSCQVYLTFLLIFFYFNASFGALFNSAYISIPQGSQNVIPETHLNHFRQEHKPTWGNELSGLQPNILSKPSNAAPRWCQFSPSAFLFEVFFLQILMSTSNWFFFLPSLSVITSSLDHNLLHESQNGLIKAINSSISAALLFCLFEVVSRIEFRRL